MNALGVGQTLVKTLVEESPYIRYRWAYTHQSRGEDMRALRTGHEFMLGHYNQLWNTI